MYAVSRSRPENGCNKRIACPKSAACGSPERVAGSSRESGGRSNLMLGRLEALWQVQTQPTPGMLFTLATSMRSVFIKC